MSLSLVLDVMGTWLVFGLGSWVGAASILEDWRSWDLLAIAIMILGGPLSMFAAAYALWGDENVQAA